MFVRLKTTISKFMSKPNIELTTVQMEYRMLKYFVAKSR